MKRGTNLNSFNKEYDFHLQADGNLEITSRGALLWSANTVNSDADFLYFNKNGNLLLQGKDNNTIWSVPVTHKGGNQLILQNVGNLVLLNLCNETISETGTNEGLISKFCCALSLLVCISFR